MSNFSLIATLYVNVLMFVVLYWLAKSATANDKTALEKKLNKAY